MVDEDHLRVRLGKQITEAVRQLLSEKHLYQSVKVDVSFLDEVAVSEHNATKMALARSLSPARGSRLPDVEQFRGNLNRFLTVPWFPSGARPLVETGLDILCANNPSVQKYQLPTAKLTCNHCGERGPFNPVGVLIEAARSERDAQWLYLSYECQNCKGEPIRFLVFRRGTKLTLSGRDPFETIELPAFIPKQHSENLRNAIIADHAGQTLAGIFLMRVFVEQFWKAIPEVADAVKGKVRPTGDELAEAYKATLPTAFKERFPTLAEVYDALSEAMHSARADASVFRRCHEQIIEHFDARRLFRLPAAKVEVDPDPAAESG